MYLLFHKPSITITVMNRGVNGYWFPCYYPGQ